MSFICTYKDSWYHRCENKTDTIKCDKHTDIQYRIKERKAKKICAYNRWYDDEFRCDNITIRGNCMCETCYQYVRETSKNMTDRNKIQRTKIRSETDAIFDLASKEPNLSKSNVAKEPKYTDDLFIPLEPVEFMNQSINPVLNYTDIIPINTVNVDQETLESGIVNSTNITKEVVSTSLNSVALEFLQKIENEYTENIKTLKEFTTVNSEILNIRSEITKRALEIENAKKSLNELIEKQKNIIETLST